MRINDRSKTDFDRAKIKLTGHFDRRPTGRYFEPCSYFSLPNTNWLLVIILVMNFLFKEIDSFLFKKIRVSFYLKIM